MIYPCLTQGNFTLFLQSQTLNRTRWTNTCTKHTTIITIAKPGNELWSPQTFDTGLQQSRMQPIGLTNLHAFSTAYTQRNEFIFIHSAWWTDDTGLPFID